MFVQSEHATLNGACYLLNHAERGSLDSFMLSPWHLQVLGQIELDELELMDEIYASTNTRVKGNSHQLCEHANIVKTLPYS